MSPIPIRNLPTAGEPNRRSGSGSSVKATGDHIATPWAGRQYALLPSKTAPASNGIPQSGSIRIGVSCVLSGPSRRLGERLLEGSRAWFDQLNATGGLHGRRIELLVKDDGYEPDPAVRNTHDFITRDRVFFLFDYVGTPTLTRVLPLLKYFEQEQIVNVAPLTGAAPQRRPPYDRYVFTIRDSYASETRALVNYFVGLGWRKIGFFGQADAYGKSGEVGVVAALERHGLKLTGGVTYQRNVPFETSMEPQVDLLRRQGVEAVVCVGTYAPCAAFIRDARRANWAVPIGNVSFVGSESLVERLQSASAAAGRDLATHLYNSQVVPLPDDLALPLVRAYAQVFPPGQRDFISLEGWLNAVVVTEALRRAGPNALRAEFIQAMESLGGWDPGLGVPLRFSPTHHQGFDRVWLTQYTAGQWRYAGGQEVTP